MSLKTKRGRPTLPPEQRKKSVSLQIQVTPEQKATYDISMGREHLIGLLELPDDDWQEVLEILSRHWDGEYRK